jgi:hypothetical protein
LTDKPARQIVAPEGSAAIEVLKMQLTPLSKWLSQQFELSVRGRGVKELYSFEQEPQSLRQDVEDY